MSDGIKNQVVTDPTGRAVAANIERLRATKRISRADLSKKLEENGVKLTAHAIGRVERLQRRLELGELTAIAFALGVHLYEILRPNHDDLDAISGSDPGITGIPTGLTSHDVELWLRGDVKMLDHRPLAIYWFRQVKSAQHLLDSFEKMEGDAKQIEAFKSHWRDELERAEHEALRHYRAAGVLREDQGLDDLPSDK